MFKILRKIRLRLLSEHKAYKYLAYAIGEILLVVIGILIALQINNWNDHRKELVLEQSYYCKLLEDVQQDINQMHSQIDKTEERLVAANEMLKLLQADDFSIKEVVGQNQAAISLITYTFRPNMAAYEDLKSSGNLKILRDNEVKRKVTEYYSMLDGMIDVMDTNADGAVALFYDKEDYAESHWQDFDFVSRGLDLQKIRLDELVPESFNREKFRKKMTSDAVFYVGSNSRIKYLYESVLPNMKEMEHVLEMKCKY